MVIQGIWDSTDFVTSVRCDHHATKHFVKYMTTSKRSARKVWRKAGSGGGRAAAGPSAAGAGALGQELARSKSSRCREAACTSTAPSTRYSSSTLFAVSLRIGDLNLQSVPVGHCHCLLRSS
eukprot:1355119-Pleurochrysis_carterae.AAC.6